MTSDLELSERYVSARAHRRMNTRPPAEDDDTAAALRDVVALADALPGQFRPEFELGYCSGVTGAESWYVRLEGDIEAAEFTMLGFHVCGRASEGANSASAEPVATQR